MIVTGRCFIQLLVFAIIYFCSVQKIFADVCSPVAKSTKYTLKENEKVSDVLRQFGLEPILGENGLLEKILQQNNVQDQDQIPASTEISVPFSCEEQTKGYKMVDRGGDRLITLDRLDTKLPGVTDSSKKTMDIINGDKTPGENPEMPADAQGLDENGEVSEALRYRMICEGEWTGSECISRYSTIFVTGGAWYNRYDGTDATTGASGVLLSKLNPEIGVGWNNYWFENFRTSLNFTVFYNDIHPEVRERPIEQSKKTINSLNADVRYETGPFGFIFGVSQTEKLFYRFFQQNIVLNDDGGVVVNAVPIFVVRTGLSYMFHQAGKFRFDAELGYLYLQGGKTSGYDVAAGHGLDLSLTVQHDRVKEYIFGTLKYEKSHQDTDILIQDAQELGFKFGYAWKLKDW